VVIGAGIAGLSAARVLSDFCSRVTVYEHDELPSTPASRATVPRHQHLYIHLGAAETEPVVAEWFLRRSSLLDSLHTIPSPRIIGRAMAHNTRL
jgi:phytoene dehydrogenase-like protein